MRKRKDEYQEKMQDGLKVVIDLQFYDEMIEKELNSLVKQLSYCHAINRKMEKPFNYILTSATGAY
jgi:Trm5-related predicted tRNA methylase